MVSKKDFIAIAKILSLHTDTIHKASLIEELSFYFETTNANFSKQKFREECYPEITKYF